MKSVRNITLFLSITLLIGLIYISFFNVYQTDDYIYSYTTRKFGVFQNIKNFYSNWGGRYFGYSISTLNPVYYDHLGLLPKIYPVFLFLAFIGTAGLNFRYYFKYTVKEALIKGFLLFFFYTVLLTGLPEHYFWVTGSNIYFLPVILSGLLLYFLGKYNESGMKTGFWLSIMLIAILMGSNEIMALIIEGLLILLYSQKKSKEYKILLAVGTVFLLVSFLAPGNFKRMSGGLELSFIQKWIKRIEVFGANSVYIFIKTALVLPLFIKIFEKELETICRKINLKKVMLIWGSSFFPLIFTGYILNPMGRQFENIIFFYCITAAPVLMLLYKDIRRYWWISLAIIFLPGTHFFPEKYSNFDINYNLNTIIKEIAYTDLGKYEEEVNERISVISTSPKDSIVVERIKTVPKVLYFGEMSSASEEKLYINDQLEKYFNKKYIRSKER
ncbi:hypothetical protein HNP38_002216 [Chryseobacterium defluvii]|uniref:Glucosyltransferase GtrII-like protein n=1 Tax=Chryseobacterium defluvii TaxID=160396 RepID=A0A840KHE4_9FLAO|nr:hypothetical protein [Chryseobacterium defluvii]MBB4806920.1 hypothetical protein [Chryseobacterium defluvii]